MKTKYNSILIGTVLFFLGTLFAISTHYSKRLENLQIKKYESEIQLVTYQTIEADNYVKVIAYDNVNSTLLFEVHLSNIDKPNNVKEFEPLLEELKHNLNTYYTTIQKDSINNYYIKLIIE